MNCDQALDLLPADVDGELPDAERGALRLHLDECPSCQATAAALRQQDAELRRGFAGRRRSASAVAERVVAELAAAPPFVKDSSMNQPTSDRLGRLRWRLGWLMAAAIGAVGFGLGSLHHNWNAPTDGERPAASSGPRAPDAAPGLTARPRSQSPAAQTLPADGAIETKAGERVRRVLPDGSVVYVNQNTRLRLEGERTVRLLAGEVFVEVAPQNAKAGEKFVVRTEQREVTALGTKFAVKAKEGRAGVLVTQGSVRVSDAGTLAAGDQLEPDQRQSSPAGRASHLLDWTRELMAAAESPLIPDSKYSGGALVAVDPYGQEAKLGLRNFHVDVHIEDGFARTIIDQTYFNHNNSRMEGTFYFPLPPDASLSRLAMYVGTDLMEGGMAERDYARDVYEKIVTSQKDPALLEWVDGSTFKMRVFPLEGRQEKRIIIGYTQRLSSLYGRAQYRFPAGHNLGLVDHFSFNARVKNAEGVTVRCESHNLKSKEDKSDLLLSADERRIKLDKDVVVELESPVITSSNGEARFSRMTTAEGDRYLMLRYRPQLLVTKQRQSRDWVFLFESSGDRDPLLARVQVDIIRTLLTNAEHNDTFTILSAGTRVQRFPDSPMPVTAENVKAAITFLEGRHLIGALDLDQALAAAEPLLKGGHNPHLVHVGSGVAAMGGKRIKELSSHIPNGARYVGVGVGKKWDRDFMKATAEKTGGFFTQINPDEAIAWRAFELASTLNTPRLMNVTVGGDTSNVRFLNFGNALAQGEELCAVARFGPKEPLPGNLTVRGSLDGQSFEQVIPVVPGAGEVGHLPRTWTKLEIERLLTEQQTKEKKQEIVDLSKAMYVMTPYTSLLVLENEAMYAEHKIDRGRKDHWAPYPAPAQLERVVYEPLDGQPVDVRFAPKLERPHAVQVRQTVIVRTERGGYMDGGTAGRSWGEDKRGANEEVLPLLVDRPISLDTAKRNSRAFRQPPLTELWATPRAGANLESSKKDLRRRIRDDEWVYERAAYPDINYFNAVVGTPIPVGRTLSPYLGLPGRQAATVGQIVITGDSPVRENVIRRQLRVYPGQGLTYRDLAASSAKLSDLNLFVENGKRPEMARIERLMSSVEARKNLNRGGPATQQVQKEVLKKLEEAIENERWGIKRIGVDSNEPRTGSLLFGFGIEGDEDHLASHNIGAFLYARPDLRPNENEFLDLMSYAPGMNTTEADIEAVTDAEALPSLASMPGDIEAGVRPLIDSVRSAGWRSLTVGTGADAVVVVFDGQGRYAYDRVLPLGLHERVVCDGTTLLHLYPELGIGARRTVSRFHRAEMAEVLPWVLPPAEDLARGADLRLIDNHTVAVLPRGTAAAKDEDGNPVPYLCFHLVINDGRLCERRLVEMPTNKVLARATYDAAGTIHWLDDKDKEVTKSERELTAAAAPNLKPETAELVVLPLPFRTISHTYSEAGVDRSLLFDDHFSWTGEFIDTDTAMSLFAAELSNGNPDSARHVYRTCLAPRGVRKLGIYTLLASVGYPVSSDVDFHKVWASHPDHPLAQYLALHANPYYRDLQRTWGVYIGDSIGADDSFLRRLSEFRDLVVRWQSGRVNRGSEASLEAEEIRALSFIRRNQENCFGPSMLCLMQDHPNGPASHRAMAEAWKLFDRPGLSYVARYEQARELAQAGDLKQAADLFRKLYQAALSEGMVPPLDTHFRHALSQEEDAWETLMRDTAAGFLKEKRRRAVVAMAWQCRQLGDEALSDNLLSAALKNPADDVERLSVTLAAVEYLSQTSQFAAADALVQPLLEHPEFSKLPWLWRLAAQVSSQRDQSAPVIFCLERALELEYQDLPSVINLEQVRSDYGLLLDHYESLARASAAMKIEPPADLLPRLIRSADRWRDLDRDSAVPCQRASDVLKLLGARDLAWDYLTTPVGQHPNEAGPWRELAVNLSRTGERDLADRAYQAAFAAEPTDAQLLWDRAQNLLRSGKRSEAQTLLRQIAEGKDWQPRFRGLQSQARWHLQGR